MNIESRKGVNCKSVPVFGEFKFLCTKRFLFERHADKGMVGTLEVTK
jgi:hypothetical protein